MPEQLTFDLPSKPALGRDDFFISSANQAAVTAVAGWPDWPGGKLVICGPVGSGKTHLAYVWASQADARVIAAGNLRADMVAELVTGNPRIVIEDIDQIAGDLPREQALFHLHNLALADGGRLLLTSRTPPTAWSLSLPDLKSRMQGSGLAQLKPPDDALLCAVLVKLFADRQVDVVPEVVAYLAPRIERSFAAAGRIVAQLDAAALARQSKISRKLAAAVLDMQSSGSA